jgi:excisionase family DNA binding protein
MNSTTPTPIPEANETKTETESTTNPEPLPEALTAEEVAALLRISRKRVYSAFKKGELPGGRRIGSALRFSRSRVLKWLFDGQERAPRSPRGAR